jgi:hypothetical protein
MGKMPRIKTVAAVGPLKLVVGFDNGIKKEYDCAPLLARSPFRLLKDPGFFRAVRVDMGGYGISWNDDVDLSEYELWTNGKPTPDKGLSHPAHSRSAGASAR